MILTITNVGDAFSLGSLFDAMRVSRYDVTFGGTAAAEWADLDGMPVSYSVKDKILIISVRATNEAVQRLIFTWMLDCFAECPGSGGAEFFYPGQPPVKIQSSWMDRDHFRGRPMLVASIRALALGGE